jgi:guanylate kinase
LLSTGQLIVITGPSGVGKGTLLQILSDRHPGEILFSISVTTRQPRVGEVDGREYFFWTREKFAQSQTDGEFLEWAEYAGNLYGTPRRAIEEWIEQGRIVLLEIELKGARQVAQSFPSAKRIFIAPPSMQVLEQRLRQRSTDSDEAIDQRLEHARKEVEAAQEFDQVIVNESLEAALNQLEKAVFSD